MANVVLDRSTGTEERKSSSQDHIRRLVWKLAIATLLLMAIGSATRVMNAGLACPDWSLCYGALVPWRQMNFQVFLEWFHRLDAGLIGCGAIALVVLSWWHRHNLPTWLPKASILALTLIIFQAVLGGLTVTELLRFDIVTAHLGAALLFFITLLVIGFTLMPYQATGTTGQLGWIGLIAALLTYCQSLLGGLVASQWALHQCFGYEQLCVIMNTHIWGVLPASMAILTLVILVWRTATLAPILRRLANWAGSLLILQIILGVATFRLHLQVEPLTVAHQSIGAALLGSLVAFTVLAIRDVKESLQTVSQPIVTN